MSTIVDCLEGIVGIAHTNCECTGTPPEGFDSSMSGLYLDSLFDVNLFKGLENCSETFWEELIKARQVAIMDVQKDIFTHMRVIPRRERFTGAIGSINTKKVLNKSQQYVGLRLYCADVVGGTMTINKIGTYFSQIGHTITVKVLDIFETELYSFEIEVTEPYQDNILPYPIVLPLHDDLLNNCEYFIVYEQNGHPAYANDIDCKCGSFKPYFDRRRPYFNTQTGKSHGFAKWVMIGSYAGDLTELDCLTDVSDTCMNGLVLRDVDIKCSTSQMFCLHDWNFEDPFDVTVAFAILHKFGLYAVDYFLRSPEFDRENLINRDVLTTAKIDFLADYEKEIEYIASQFPLEETDCFECSTPNIHTSYLW